MPATFRRPLGASMGLALGLGCWVMMAAPEAATSVPAAAPAAIPQPGMGARPAAGRVLNGIDVLAKQNYAPVKNLRLGLITNHTGHDRQRSSTIDLLKQAPGVTLKVLFCPEHGLRGLLDEKIKDSVDGPTGLPVFSLYGEHYAPLPEQLQGLDALVFDLQDIGCRFYTYISTLRFRMEAAARAGLRFFVLDRVNPLGGEVMEGPVYQGKTTFTAYHALPLRYGMTLGELARMYNAERQLQANLTVVPLAGWKRSMWFDETDLPWSNPSPNMRSLTAAMLYPGDGLHETALSVGRGTDTPFELLGAPYIDDVRWAAELNRAALPGVRFVPIRFTPAYSTFKNQPCGGVAILVTDRTRLRAVDVGLLLALTLYRLYPAQFELDQVNRLLQHDATITAIRAGQSLEQIKRAWAPGLQVFKQRRKPFLIYH